MVTSHLFRAFLVHETVPECHQILAITLKSHAWAGQTEKAVGPSWRS